MTSHDVVGRLRKITGERSIGHLGTLDPMATGVLPLLLGKFTRLAQYFSSAEKSYTGAIRFGFSTDTYDAEGEAGPGLRLSRRLRSNRCARRLAVSTARWSRCRRLTPQRRLPARRLISWRAQGKPVELKTATVRIAGFEITALEGAEASFTMSISAGGYVRSVAHELGQDLGCGAHLSSLRRTQAGVFTLAEAHTLEELQSLAGNLEALEALCIHPRSLLPEMPSVTGDEMALGRLRNGAQANLPEFSARRW